ncbi:GNAT family N-acetyltransferase [Alkalihalobacillus macyae]|uniref:GNAT family N-acetyltransferase n=1 Tax=Guptibacillus hwajinpoensis TaxID=208199 RepID=UPI00273C691D|nr:GNAT family N-acetyltransferase [Alkalihalobacillus macyae]MDP4549662.1 GNAT family N-acetyltransferase [Alkalihalobacillus macyae]
MLTIKSLHSTDIEDSMLDTFNRSQVTQNVLVHESGHLLKKEDSFHDEWTFQQKREIVEHFRHVLNLGGAVIVATMELTIVGFAVIESEEFGQTFRYRELSYIHVTSEHRGKGIGSQLFDKTRNVARELGADKLYIGSHPAVETQRFYSEMGCVLAKEINESIYLRETRDIQLEFDVSRG